MQPWIETTLAELERAEQTALERLKKADHESTLAGVALSNARNLHLTTHNALKYFRWFAEQLGEGGAL